MKNEITIDQNKLKAFFFDNILPSTRGAMSIIMAIIGDKLGLFKAMCDYGSVTAEMLSSHTGMHHRYLQEWLSALAAAHWIDYDRRTKEFHLTPEQAMVFVDSNSLMYFQGVFGLGDACHLDLKKIISAFKSGVGIPFEHAKIDALEKGITNAKFQVNSVKDFPGNNYDFICYFDCLHDLGDLVGTCKYAKNVLKTDGCLMLVEPTAEDKLEENFGDINAISYAMSTCICIPTSLAQDVGLALGAQAGPA